MKHKYLGQILLVLAALIWGSSFVVMKSAVDFLTPNVLLFVRFALATLFMTLLFFKQVKTISRKNLKGGILAGIALYLAYTVQTIGLTYTTPGKNAFLTAVYCAIVPFFVWLVDKKRPDKFNIIASLMCFIGVGLVSLDSNLTINIGDIYTLIGGVMYAIHIMIVKHYTKMTSPVVLTTIQFFVAGCLAGIGGCLFEDINLVFSIHQDVIIQILYLAFFATTLTLLFQSVGQKMVSQCQASILLSLESVFGVLFSVLCGSEYLNGQILLGFVVIFCAIIISETKLSFLRRSS